MDKLALIPLNNIAITDAFWNKYVELVKTVSFLINGTFLMTNMKALG